MVGKNANKVPFWANACKKLILCQSSSASVESVLIVKKIHRTAAVCFRRLHRSSINDSIQSLDCQTQYSVVVIYNYLISVIK